MSVRVPVPPAVPRAVAAVDPALAAVVAAMAAFTLVFTRLALLRHDAFWTGRFDLGNMVQAVWSTAHGHPLEVTNTAGVQFIRLGAHVDPLLVVFAPLWRLWPDPRMLLVSQVVIVAVGALPVFLLGRRWIGHDGLAVACAVAYLMYPAVQWSVLTEFHPVTLATPLVLGCVWAVDAHRPWWLAVCAVAAALGKEQVGVALAMLGVWVLLRRRWRRAGWALVVGGVAWSAFAVGVVIPHFSPTGTSPFVGRYAELGQSQGDIVRGILTDPLHALSIAVQGGRPTYLAALFLPLLLMPLLAPLVALGALPDLVLNVLAQYWPQYGIQYQYTAVISAFLIAGTVGGMARAHARVGHGRALAGALILAVLASGYSQGPLPFWRYVPGGSHMRTEQYTVDAHSRAEAAAVALVPRDPDVPVSATNLLGTRLSARRHIYTWPVIRGADWVLVDERRPYLADRISTFEHTMRVLSLKADRRFRLRFSRDGVLVFERIRARA